MNNILEAACAGQLHWDCETIRRYTLDHAPEVNQGSAQRHASQPPPLPSNADDDWFRRHPKLPGSSKAPRKLPLRRHNPRRQRASVRPPKPKARSYQPRSRGSRRSHTGIDRELWLCEKSGGTRSPLNSSSKSCLSRGWCEKLLRTWARSTFASRAGP